jgi:DNA-binding transcriptional ArsR family regulator
MNGTLNDGTRFDAPPWEPLGRSFDGHESFSDSKGMGGLFTMQASRYEARSSRTMVEVKSGLTRRGVINEYVRKHPGAHVRGMAKGLRLATGDLQYHLIWLEKHGFVKTKKSGFYRFVFPTMVFNEGQEVLLGVLSQETPREILLCLLRDAALTQGDLAKGLGHSQPTISWHMDRLIKLGIVSKRRSSVGMVYEVTADPHDIVSYVKSYYPAVWKRWAGRLADFVLSAGTKTVDKGGALQRAGLLPPAVVETIGAR